MAQLKLLDRGERKPETDSSKANSSPQTFRCCEFENIIDDDECVMVKYSNKPDSMAYTRKSTEKFINGIFRRVKFGRMSQFWVVFFFSDFVCDRSERQ